MRSVEHSACVWMEKQQLDAIGIWIREVLEKLDREQPTDEPEEGPGAFLDAFDLDFRASQLGLGYAEDANLSAIQAYDSPEALERQSPTLRCFLSRGPTPA